MPITSVNAEVDAVLNNGDPKVLLQERMPINDPFGQLQASYEQVCERIHSRLRDEFAKAALNGFCSNTDSKHEWKGGQFNEEWAARFAAAAYLVADAMLLARSAPSPADRADEPEVR